MELHRERESEKGQPEPRTRTGSYTITLPDELLTLCSPVPSFRPPAFICDASAVTRDGGVTAV
jgi:hypothetical protein